MWSKTTYLEFLLAKDLVFFDPFEGLVDEIVIQGAPNNGVNAVDLFGYAEVEVSFLQNGELVERNADMEFEDSHC